MNELLETIGILTAGGFGAGLGLTVLRGLWSAVTYREQTLWANTKVEVERAKNQHALPPQSFNYAPQIDYAPHNTNTVHGAPATTSPFANNAAKPGESVFDAIDAAFHTIVLGPTGTGKTLLINELVRERWAKEGLVVVIDPDNHKEKWDAACTVLPSSLEQADATFEQKVMPLFNERHAWYESHGGAIPKRKIHLIIDEAHDVLNECAGVFSNIVRLVKRGRKLGFSVTLVSTDGQSGSLGLKGKMKLLTNMARVELKIENGKRLAYLEGALYELPQIHRDVAPVDDDDQPLDSIPGDADFVQAPGDRPKNGAVTKMLDVTDEQIADWLREGLSKNKICLRFSGSKQTQLERIRKVELALNTAA